MATQATVLAPAEHTALTSALGFKGEINALHREALKSGNEMMRNAIRCGELLEEVKGVLKAAKSTSFEIWIERNLDFSPQSARSYMRLYNDLGRLPKTKAAFVLKNADSISEARRLISSALPEPEEKEPPTMTETSPPYELPKPVRTFSKPIAPEPIDVPEEPAEPDEPCPEPAEPEAHSSWWPEPWTCDSYYIRDAEGNEVIETVESSRDTLNRIVACVNAMAGILEPGAFMKRAGRPKTG
jgi:hypothetical protein